MGGKDAEVFVHHVEVLLELFVVVGREHERKFHVALTARATRSNQGRAAPVLRSVRRGVSLPRSTINRGSVASRQSSSPAVARRGAPPGGKPASHPSPGARPCKSPEHGVPRETRGARAGDQRRSGGWSACPHSRSGESSRVRKRSDAAAGPASSTGFAGHRLGDVMIDSVVRCIQRMSSPASDAPRDPTPCVLPAPLKTAGGLILRYQPDGGGSSLYQAAAVRRPRA